MAGLVCSPLLAPSETPLEEARFTSPLMDVHHLFGNETEIRNVPADVSFDD